jgi:hypothetical protein
MSVCRGAAAVVPLHVDQAQATAAGFMAFHGAKHGNTETIEPTAASHPICGIAHHNLGVIVPRSMGRRDPVQPLRRNKLVDGSALLVGQAPEPLAERNDRLLVLDALARQLLLVASQRRTRIPADARPWA